MKHSYLVHPLKLAVSLATAAVSLVLAVCLFSMGRPGSAVFFLLIAVLFFLVLLQEGAVITIAPEGITRSVLGKTTKRLSWNEIAEIGVAGSKVFNPGNKNRTGTLYIYVSETAMDDDERFQMMLKWPPKNMIYLQHTKKRMDAIQFYWSRKVETYNAGELHF